MLEYGVPVAIKSPTAWIASLLSFVPVGANTMNFPTGIPEDLDLDNVLDNYLTQLHGDAPAGAAAGMQASTAGMPMMADGLAALGGGNLGGMAGLVGMQGMLNHGMYGGMAGLQGMAGMGMGMQQNNLAAAAAAAAGNGRQNSAKAKSGGARGRRASEKAVSKGADDDSDAQSSDGSASSGEQKSRKKREIGGDDDMTAAEKRHLALQEKNRRAQRRFRERQKVRHFSASLYNFAPGVDGFFPVAGCSSVASGLQRLMLDWHRIGCFAQFRNISVRMLLALTAGQDPRLASAD